MERQGTMEMTVYNFLQADSEYLEVWWGDGKNKDTCKELLELINHARNIGFDKYKAELIRTGKYKPPGSSTYNRGNATKRIRQ